MSVTLQINTFPDGSLYSEEMGLRPQQEVWWTGASGTTDVLHEWDTVSTFDSGDLITDLNVAQTAPDVGVPPSDLGGDKSWFYRVTVTDHGDETDEVQRVLHDHTGGTFTLSFDGQGPTGAINWDDDGSGIKTALELFSNITTVSVVESATGDWLVTFEDPGDEDVAMMTADGGNLTGGTTIGVTENTKGSGPGIDVEPGAGGREMIMFPSLDMARYHHILVNVIPDFVIGGTDDPIEQFRHLYLLNNIIPDFAIGGVDDAVDQYRHLWLLSNITTLQPCPFFDTMNPTLVSTGEAVNITGDSFGALQSTYDTEVRLYADGPALSGSFITLVATSWSDSEISATVPGGATSGWVTLVQTNGSETCPSSGFKILQVIQTPPDPDAGWWLLTADKENDLTQTQTILPGNTSKTSFKKIMNDIGSGKIELPLGDPQIANFIDPDTRHGVLVRTYLDDRFRYAWFTEKLSHDYDEEGNKVAVITGRGMEVVAEWAKVKPHDFPASPTKAPTWIYGSNDNLVRNGTFEEDLPILRNPGGEDGNDDEGNVEGWAKRGNDSTDRTAVQAPANALEGDWFIRQDADDNHSGIQQSVTVTPGKTYHVQVRVKDPGATGMRLTLALGGAEDIAAIGVTYPNNFAYGGEILAELDNVARNPAKNGLPGGSTDGLWQVMDVEVQTGEEQTSMSISIQNDHHGAGIFNLWWLDSVTIDGWGLGLEPWVAFDPDNHASNSFRLDTATTFEGSSHSLKINPLAKFAGIQQVIQVTPNTKYTSTIWALTTGALGDDTYKLEVNLNDGSDPATIHAFTELVLSPGWNPIQVVWTSPANMEEMIFRFVYSGPNNPPPVYVDKASLVPGEPPSTAGKIVNDVLDKMALDNILTYLLRSFTDDLDSLGAAWPAPLSMDIEPEESLAGLLGRLVALGHEWEIVPVDFAEGGDGGFELNLYTGRPFNPETGIGTNYTQDPEGPVIHPGDATIGGRVIKTAFNTNSVMAIGEEGVWSRVQQHPWLDADQPVGDPAAHGYLESFGPIEDVLSVPAGDATTVAQFAQSRLAEEKDKEKQLQLEMQRSSVIRPFLTFLVGDSVYADMPPYHPDPDKADPKRVRALTFDGAGEGADINFSVDLNRVVYEDELAWFALIAQLNERAPAENTGSGTGKASSSGGGGGGSTVVLPGSTGPVPLHTHDLKGTDIKSRALTGDVSGSLPGPITVNAIKGNSVEGVIPVDVGGDPVLMIYDRDLNQWAGVETALAGAGGLPMTAKGDLHTFTTVDAPLAKGTDGFVLMVDDVEATGLKWVALLEADISDFGSYSVTSHTHANPIHDDIASEISAIAVKGTPVSGDFLLIEDSAAGNIKKHVTVGSLPGGGGGPDVLTTKGDIHGYDTDDNRVPVGTNDQVLTADSAAALGVKWADATGGGGGGAQSGYLRAERITSAQVITTSTATDVIYNSITQEDDADGHFALNTSTGVVTLNTTGWYIVVAEILWEGSTAGRRILTIQSSAEGEVGGADEGNPTTNQKRMQATAVFPATAADTVTIEAFHTVGSDLDIDFGEFTNLSVTFIGSALSAGPEVTTALLPSVDTPPIPDDAHANNDEFDDGSVDTAWVFVNQDGATLTESVIGQYLDLDRTTTSGGHSVSVANRAVPSTPWTFTVKMDIEHSLVDFGGGGIGLREVSSGKLISIMRGIHAGGQLVEVIKSNSPTSYNSTPVGDYDIGSDSGPIYLQVEDDGTDIFFRVGSGSTWAEIFVEPRGTFFTTGPDMVYLSATQESTTPTRNTKARFYWSRFNWVENDSYKVLTDLSVVGHSITQGGMILLGELHADGADITKLEVPIPSDVRGLRIVGNVRSARADVLDRLRVYLGSGGVVDDTGTNYFIYSDDGVASDTNVAADGFPVGRFSLPGDTELADTFGPFVCEVQGLQEAVFKGMRGDAGYADASGRRGESWGQWQDTSRADIVRVEFENDDFLDGSRFMIYGYVDQLDVNEIAPLTSRTDPRTVRSPSVWDDEFQGIAIDGTRWTRVARGTPVVTWEQGHGKMSAQKTTTGSITSELDAWMQAYGGTVAVGTVIEIAGSFLNTDLTSGLFVGFSNGTTFSTSDAVGIWLHPNVDDIRPLFNEWDGFDSRTNDGDLIAFADWMPARTEFYIRVTYEAANTWGFDFSFDGNLWRGGETGYAATMTPTHFGFGMAMLATDGTDEYVNLHYFRVNSPEKADQYTGGGGVTGYPGTVLDALYSRPADETVHPDDQEFNGADLSTLLVVSGTGVATQKRGVHNIVYDGQSSADAVASLWPLTESFPVTIETSGQALINNANFHQAMPLILSDGVTATDDLVFIFLHRAGTVGFNFGTFTVLDGSGGSSTALGGGTPMGRMYYRLIWSASNTFKMQFSIDGVGWSDMDVGSLARTITPTHFGFGGTSWGATDPGMVSADYLRVTAADLSL